MSSISKDVSEPSLLETSEIRLIQALEPKRQRILVSGGYRPDQMYLTRNPVESVTLKVQPKVIRNDITYRLLSRRSNTESRC